MTRLNPKKWDYRTWRKFFYIAALWNFFFSIPALIFPSLQVQLMYGFKTTSFYILYLNTALFITVLIFGIGYFMIAQAPEKNLGLVKLGIIGKTVVGVGFYALFSAGRVTFIPVLGGTGDLIFTFYFITYLLAGPRSAGNDFKETTDPAA